MGARSSTAPRYRFVVSCIYQFPDALGPRYTLTQLLTPHLLATELRRIASAWSFKSRALLERIRPRGSGRASALVLTLWVKDRLLRESMGSRVGKLGRFSARGECRALYRARAPFSKRATQFSPARNIGLGSVARPRARISRGYKAGGGPDRCARREEGAGNIALVYLRYRPPVRPSLIMGDITGLAAYPKSAPEMSRVLDYRRVGNGLDYSD